MTAGVRFILALIVLMLVAMALIIVLWPAPSISQRQAAVWLDPLMPVVTALAAIMTVYVSRPERRGLAGIIAALLLISAVWGGVSAWRNSGMRLALQEAAYGELKGSTDRLLSLISSIITHASDEWVPSDEDEFFSSETARLICQHLNLEAEAPVLPRKKWLTWIAQQTNEVQDQYTSVFNAYSSVLDEELFRALRAVQSSFFLTWPSTRVSLQHASQTLKFQYPPIMLCGEKLYDIENSLSQLRTLYNILSSRTNSKPRTMPKKALGRSRFGPEDLARWMKEHPYAPSGKPPK